MIIRSQTPLRLGLAGGGTDINLHCDQYTGYVLNTTVSLYVHCILTERNDQKIISDSSDTGIRVEYQSKEFLENDDKLDLYKMVYNRLIKDCVKRPSGFSLYTYSDVPGGSRLGGSSTLVVGTVRAFAEWLNLPLGEYGIACLVYEIEREDMAIVGGAQDRYAAAFGGFNFMEFHDQKRVIVNPLRIKNWIVSELEARVLFYFTNITREAKDIEEHKRGKLGDENSLNAMHAIKQDALDMKEALFRADFEKVAQILDKSWQSKKIISEIVSNDELERIYYLAMENGTYSGKISGAGAGGFMLFMVDPMKKYKLRKILNEQQGYVQEFYFTKEGAKSWKV